MNWRPIETAPKDGAYYLFLHKNGGMHTACWNSTFEDWRIAQSSISRQFTHWMPLPPPPSTEPAPQDTGERWEVVNEYGEHNLYRGNEYVGEVRFEEQGQEICASMNLLAGHDLSQVVVVKKEVLEDLKDFLSQLSNRFGGTIIGNRAFKLEASLNAAD